MIQGLSHMTFIARDLDRMEALLTSIPGAKKVYDSGDQIFSLSKGRFMYGERPDLAVFRPSALEDEPAVSCRRTTCLRRAERPFLVHRRRGDANIAATTALIDTASSLAIVNLDVASLVGEEEPISTIALVSFRFWANHS